MRVGASWLVGWLVGRRQEQEAPNIDSDVLLVLCRLVSLDIEVVVVGIGGGRILENGGVALPSKTALAP